MNINKKKDHTAGMNSLGLCGNIIIAGVIFAGIQPWWLIAGGAFMLIGLGLEFIQDR